MAFAYVGARGSTSTKSTGTTLSMSPSSDMDPGAFAVIYWTWDGGNAGGEAFSVLNERWSCRDDAGNIWCSLFGCTEGFGHQAAGIFVTQLRNGLATTDTVTVRCQITLRECKAMTLHEFSLDPDLVWAASDQIGANAQITAEPPPVGVDLTGQMREWLFLTCTGIRGPNTDSYTWDSDFVQLASVGTSGGSDTSNCQLHSGYRIAVDDYELFDIETNPDRSFANGCVAVCEADLVGFPTLDILDDFNRADENPIAGLWSTATCIPTTANKARIVSNQAAGQAGSHGGQWFTGDPEEIYIGVLPDCDTEVYATFPVFGSLGAGLILGGSGCGNAATRGGYEVAWLPGPQNRADTSRIDNGFGDFIAWVRPRMNIWADLTNGAKLGLQRIQNTNHVWIDEGGGWERIAATFYISASASGNLGGQIGFELFDGTTRMDDYGGGFDCFIPQIIRRVIP